MQRLPAADKRQEPANPTQKPTKMGDLNPIFATKSATFCHELINQCSTFDNRTGRVTHLDPCDVVVRDSYGVPVPTGTIRRLDAISKSFSLH